MGYDNAGAKRKPTKEWFQERDRKRLKREKDSAFALADEYCQCKEGEHCTAQAFIDGYLARAKESNN